MNKNQLPLDAIPRARTTDPKTSQDAADSVRNVTEVQLAILDILASNPTTDTKLIQKYRGRAEAGSGLWRVPYPYASESGIRTRRRELADRGFVQDTGAQVKLPSGRKAVVWAITPAGEDVLYA